MRCSFLLSLVLLATPAVTQEIVDADKHGFDKLPAIYIDIDGDGKTETIRPRTYTTPLLGGSSNQRRQVARAHWIAFDLILANGQMHTAFFRYRYGDDQSDYWVWALKSAGDVNNDGRVDLVFYSGDDTTDETVLLVQDRRRFRACSTGVILGEYRLDRDFSISTLSRYDARAGREIARRQIARWNPRFLFFEGRGLFWVRTGTALRAEPRQTAESIIPLRRDDAVIAVFNNDAPVTRGDWLKVETEYGTGWVHRQALAANSRFVRR
jgi:hypothetical protein